MIILIFFIGDERYGIEVQQVLEIVRATAVTRLPGLPQVVTGIVDLGGDLVPVIDTRHRLGLPSAPISPDEYFIFTRTAARTVALRADGVQGVEEVAEATIADPQEIHPAVEHVSGIAQIAGGLLLIQDVERFLSPAEHGQLEGVEAQLRGVRS